MTKAKWTAEQQKIANLDASWGEAATKALKQGAAEADFKAVTDIYARDGTVLWPGFELGRGSAQIEAHWKQANAGFQNSELKFNPIGIDIIGTLALDCGEVVFKSPAPGGKTTVDVAKYLVVWRHQDGAWKVLYDAWNENKAS